MNSLAASRCVLFRADAGLMIGSGHVMRCLTLASAMRERGTRCVFACRPRDGDMIAALRDHDFEVHEVVTPGRGNESGLAHADWLGGHWEDDAATVGALVKELRPDWLVVDHYALDHRWEERVQGEWPSMRVLVVDDLADRSHRADLLLDQNLGRTSACYAALVSPSCHFLLGPRHALLRPEFALAREASLARRRGVVSLNHILISLGGVDQNNATGRALDALSRCDLPADCRITVVMGAAAPWLQEVIGLAESLSRPTEVVVNISDMGRRMAAADLAIGAAGSTSWERCCLGLPTLMVVLADNQLSIAKALDRLGAAIDLGAPDQLKTLPARWPALTDEDTLRAMSESAAGVTDGLGAERVIRAMQGTGS
ncbi:UDP-2,4-diacetamido-2,4,6-trideoxy-beta-L-altropyranose hydrolase [Alloalcanivorax sp. C16-2]|uniref:UDP-2,4-diacetamido-2,4, 6-trideoxy-beta-L-altropyranose hydrolase n=1 Tax=Alloalcanivorax sp. C16-2 TaxID=3390052 RepID=UPI003970E133